MNGIDIFYQGEGITGVEHVEFPADETIAVLKVHLAKKHGLDEDILIFIEDEEEPVEDAKHLHRCAGSAGVKLHLHRCHRVTVTVTFNNETKEHKFAPSTTVARVKRWAAKREFGMSPEDAGEHVLQLVGTKERPSPSAHHIGALVTHRKCELAFDLVPDERVNGASEVVR